MTSATDNRETIGNNKLPTALIFGVDYNGTFVIDIDSVTDHIELRWDAEVIRTLVVTFSDACKDNAISSVIL